ncbi:hypothetical protein DFH09DRAFT_1171434 [Mycena vulgaris]|nr:hypothetical protein DFH09DRAFT_1171434 [Mycena vulgaris]
MKAHLDAFVYPVLTLPNEITSEIFFQSIGSLGVAPGAPTSPLFLGHICQSWREIALTTPSLWTEMTLIVGAVAARENQLRLLKTWLTRSRDCPLTIALQYRPPILPVPAGHDSVHEFIDAISPHRRRCHTLSLILPLRDIFRFDGEFTSLQALAIGVSDLPDETQTDPSWPMEIFHRAPKLRALVIAGGFNPNTVLLPWAQIMMLANLAVPFPNDLAEVLRSTTNLSSLRVDIMAPDDNETIANIPEIPLTNLRSLELGSNSDPRACMQLLEKLVLPGLVDLHISEPGFLPNPAAPIQNLLSRSGCNLRTLNIEIVDARRPKAYYTRSLPSVGTIVVLRGFLDEIYDSDEDEESGDASSEG